MNKHVCLSTFWGWIYNLLTQIEFLIICLAFKLICANFPTIGMSLVPGSQTSNPFFRVQNMQTKTTDKPCLFFNAFDMKRVSTRSAHPHLPPVKKKANPKEIITNISALLPFLWISVVVLFHRRWWRAGDTQWQCHFTFESKLSSLYIGLRRRRFF